MKVTRVGVYWNSGKAHGLSCARELIALLEHSGLELVPERALALALGTGDGVELERMARCCQRRCLRRVVTCRCWA